LERLVDDLLLEVAEDNGNLQAAESERRDLGRHQAGADDSELADRSRLNPGSRCGSLCAALDEIERIEGRLRLRAWHELGDRLLLASVALVDRPGRGASQQLEGDVRGGRGAVHLVVDLRSGAGGNGWEVAEVGLVPRLLLVGEIERECNRVVHELDRLEQSVRVPALE